MEGPSKGLIDTAKELPPEDRVIRHRGGPFIRVATVCQELIEEKQGDAITVFRLIDGFYEPQETEDGLTPLSGFATFIGYEFPGAETQPTVSFVITDDQHQILRSHDRQIDIQGPHRGFAIATALEGMRVPYGRRYSISMVYRLVEFARAYIETWVGSADGPTQTQAQGDQDR